MMMGTVGKKFEGFGSSGDGGKKSRNKLLAWVFGVDIFWSFIGVSETGELMKYDSHEIYTLKKSGGMPVFKHNPHRLLLQHSCDVVQSMNVSDNLYNKVISVGAEMGTILRRKSLTTESTRPFPHKVLDCSWRQVEDVHYV